MKNKKAAYLLFFFLLGAGSTIAQSVIFREFLVIFYGNELVVGFVLFFWLFSITAGALLFSPLSKKIKNPDRLFINLVFIFSLLPYILIPFIRESRNFTATPFGQFVPFSGMIWVSLAAIFPAGFLIGFTFPLGCRVLNNQSAVTKIYIAESIGSLAGGVVFSFIFVRLFPVVLIAAFLNLGFVLCLMVFNMVNRSRLRKRGVFAFFIAVIITVLLFAFSGRVDLYSKQARWKSLAENLPLLASADSPYQNISLTKQMDLYSIYFNGVYGFSFPDEYDEPVFANLVMTQHPKPENVLVIGDTTPGFIRECLKHKPESIDVVYLDPELYKIIYPVLSEEDKKIFSGKNVKFIVSDGRTYVKNCGKKYDLIFINLPDPSTAQLNRYYTLEFFRELSAIASKGGVMGLKITSSENYAGSIMLDYNRVILNTIRQVFPEIAVSSGERVFIFASAQKKQVTDDFRVLFDRYNKRHIEESAFSPYIFETIYEPDRVKQNEKNLRDVNDSRLNTDLFPTAYLYNLKLWDKYSGSKLEKVFGFSGSLRAINIFFGIMIILIPSALLVFLKKQNGSPRSFCPLYSTFTTGFCAMGLSVLLIYAYQNIYGYLFERIGFLFALFMLGLGAGGFIVHFLGERNKAGTKSFVFIQFLIALLCLSLPVLISFLGGLDEKYSFLFFMLVIVSGILTGQIFPLSAILLQKKGITTEKSASLVDGADHLGGCLAALLVGTFLTPFMGIPEVARLLGFIEISALVLWGIQILVVRFRHK
ncbi:MAG: hypothetical protein LWY06_12130 [Firmicutes bacterium]|nr:hypothetical protein [Bacillota bacterium]